MHKVNMKKAKIKQKPKKNLTRKELRKQKQAEKKQHKRIFFSSKSKGKELVVAAIKAQQEQMKNVKNKTKKKRKNKAKQQNQLTPENITQAQLLSGHVDSDNDESIASDFSDADVDTLLMAKTLKNVENAANNNNKKPKKQLPVRPEAEAVRRKDIQRQKDLEKAARKQRVKQLKIENETEDKLITNLEKKLKLNKSKDKNRLVRKMFNDGLDYALDLCLDDEEEKRKLELKAQRRREQEAQAACGWSDADESGEECADSKTNDDINDDDDDDVEGNDFGLAGDDDSDEDVDDSAVSDVDEPAAVNKDNVKTDKTQFKEDIYGRKRDKDGNIITESNTQKYIPPHQRARLAAQNDDKQKALLERLRKSCKGLLNRLSEANLHKIAAGIEELYMKNSRFNMNETLTQLLNEVLIGKTIANERMVQEHMVLLAFLHANVGSEIGAHFLQTFIEQFDKFIKEIKDLAVENKSLNNLVMVLSYMYIFKIYEHRLLLEIIEKLSDNLCEKSIECLLLIFKSVGFKLRKDDPMAFKQMMLSVQKKIADSPLEMKENLRMKFMVDILNAVKNNNINKIPQFDPELAENLRKRLKVMLRNDKYVITLNITMEDLLRADQVGKWWIVGSAWSGNINDVAAATKSGKNATGATTESTCFSAHLLELAKKQKMNTEERRNIFCIIMSAEDYVDAFEKILHLSLKDQRIIAYVILHCCLNERQTNPYYAHLALKFCNYNRKFQLGFQFASWDRINDIDALTKQQIKNLAKFLQYLILNGGLALSVLKVVDFLQLQKLSFYFLKHIMLDLLLATNETSVNQAFERVAKNNKLVQFKNSIRLFIKHFLLEKSLDKLKLNDENMTLLKRRVANVDNILAYVDL